MAINSLGLTMQPERRGVGVVVPFDFQADHDLWAYLDDSVTLHLTRTSAVHDAVISVNLAALVGDLDDVADAASRVTAVADTLVYACTSGSFITGNAGERALVDAMLKSGAARAGTTSGGLREALAAVGARRVAVVSPYDVDLTDRLVAFLTENGHQVTNAVSMGLLADVHRVSPQHLADLAIEADTSDTDAVFLSCTGLATFDLIEPLEAMLGKPVLAANQVTMWKALRLVEAPASPGALRQRLFHV